MAVPPAQIRIPFQPLMRQVVECLHFRKTMYNMFDIDKNNVCVAVRPGTSAVAYVYIGGEAPTLEESCEGAAEKATRSLIKKYDVIVEDFTSARNRGLERCARLYHLKRVELEGIESRHLQLLPPEHHCMDIRVSVKHVCLNYMGVLLAPIEHLQFGPHTWVCWLTFTSPHRSNAMESVVGDYTETLEDAKQSVANKAIYFLMRLYAFDLVGANYGSGKYAALVYSFEQESCSTVRERMSVVKETIRPSALVIEQDCLTPRGCPPEDCLAYRNSSAFGV